MKKMSKRGKLTAEQLTLEAFSVAAKGGHYRSIVARGEHLLQERVLSEKESVYLLEGYWTCGILRTGLEYGEGVVKRYPDNELLSLILFHLYLDENKLDDAKKECFRFLENNSSSEYDVICNERGWSA